MEMQELLFLKMQQKELSEELGIAVKPYSFNKWAETQVVFDFF